MLDAIGRIEHDAEQIRRPGPHQVEHRRGAAAGERSESVQVRERRFAVGGIVEDHAAGWLQVDPVAIELARQLGRIREALTGRGEETAHHESVHRTNRI